MGPQRLGLLNAVVILWVNGFVIGLIVSALVQNGAGTWVLAGGLPLSDRHGFTHWVIVVAIQTAVTAGGVCLGVALMGFRIGYGAAFFALLMGVVVTGALDYALTPHQSSTAATSAAGTAASGFQLAASSMLMLPLGLVAGLLMPAVMVDSFATDASATRSA